MTNLATRNGSTAPVAQFVQRNTEETLAELHRPIDPRHFKTRKQGNTTLTYVPWATLCKHLHHRCPGFCCEIRVFKRSEDRLWSPVGLTIPTTDAILHYSAVASEKLDSGSMAPPAEVAASSCLKRAAAFWTCIGIVGMRWKMEEWIYAWEESIFDEDGQLWVVTMLSLLMLPIYEEMKIQAIFLNP